MVKDRKRRERSRKRTEEKRKVKKCSVKSVMRKEAISSNPSDVGFTLLL